MTQEFSPEEIAALELALETGEIMRQPTEPQLDDQTFWYLPAAGSSPDGQCGGAHLPPQRRRAHLPLATAASTAAC